MWILFAFVIWFLGFSFYLGLMKVSSRADEIGQRHLLELLQSKKIS
ncbi:hypothetical protein [Bacillus sp. Y1]|nr:hypothetical protein [Bacillus sp. Y1]